MKLDYIWRAHAILVPISKENEGGESNKILIIASLDKRIGFEKHVCVNKIRNFINWLNTLDACG